LKFHNLYRSLIGGLILALAWPVSGLGWSTLLFIGFIPFLFLEKNIAEDSHDSKNFRLFNYTFLMLFVWNILTTWWIYYASFGGAAMAVITNSFFMALVLLLFHVTRKKAGDFIGYFSLILYWLAFEYIHLNWDLTWPWLTLGNGFATSHLYIQWYEYTGALGGSLWILSINLLLFTILTKGRNFIRIAGMLKLILLPALFSILITANYKTPNEGNINVVVVQPNIDPYNEKFSGLTPQEQLQKMLALAEEKIDANTDYLVGPETSLVNEMIEAELEESPAIVDIRAFLKKHPQITFVTGASTIKEYKPGETVSATARKWKGAEVEYVYDSYNTAIQIDTTKNIQLYHKSKLVPGVEKMPFPALMKPLEKFAINLGGTAGSLGMQEERSVFTSMNKKAVIGSIICYESVYGEFVGEYVNKGANILCIITNDGWWEDTPGYKQHLAYATLRAIETRRSIVRSANTGTSCFISPIGEISEPTKWWEPASIKQTVVLNSAKTFYTLHGDYIGKSALLSAMGLLIYLILLRFKLVKKS